MSKVHLDFGHGGKDPGAIGNNMKEKDVVLPVGLEVGRILKMHGVIVTYSRTIDVFLSLKERADKANRENADIFVSLHVNSSTNTTANGVETFSHTGSARGLPLAKAIQDSLVADKLFVSNRGTKTANFYVLRATRMAAALTELGFISNPQDAAVIRSKQKQIALSVAKGILKHLGIRYVAEKPTPAPVPTPKPGFNIMSKTNATIEQMKEWAKKKGAVKLFIDLAPSFYEISNKVGVNPLVTYCQSAKETGYMKFGGVLNASFKNPCGLKTKDGGGNNDPNAHQRFKSWEEGIQAQVDHLALYAGAPGYPKPNTPDPRHFPFIRGTAKTVQALGGKWAPAGSYGEDIVRMISELEKTIAPIKPVAKTIKVDLLGKKTTVNGDVKNGTNYIKVDGKDIPIRDVFESMGFKVSWDSATKTVVID